MTPERRLDRLEPLMTDALQKIDRLIEGQGKLIDMVARADQNATNTGVRADNAAERADYAAERSDYAAGRADYAASMAEIAAKGVANLTVSTQRQFDELRMGQETIMNYLREKLP